MRGPRDHERREHTDAPTDQLVGEARIAERWNCSRSTVRRILDAAGVPVFFLSGRERGIKRYSLSDVKRVEESARSDRT